MKDKFKFTPVGTKPNPTNPQGSMRHFYATSCAEWLTNESIEQLIADMKRSGLPFTLWTIPYPISEPYEIKGYVPQIEGAVLLGRFDYNE